MSDGALSTRLGVASTSVEPKVLRGLRVVFWVLLLPIVGACVDLSEDSFAPLSHAQSGTVTPLGASSGGIWTPVERDVTEAAEDDVPPSFDALGDLPVATEAIDEPAGPAAVDLFEVSPEVGATAGGGLVTLRGEGFQAGMTAWFGHAEALDVFVISGDYANVHVPPGPPGAVEVLVINPDGGEASLAGGFTYTATLTLDALAPAEGPAFGGTAVTMLGDGFEAPLEVYVGGRAAIALVSIDARTLSFVAPPGREGPADVVIFANGRRFVADRPFRYTAAPELLRVEPPAGPLRGDRLVRLHGRGLGPDAEVTFAGRSARVRSVLPGRWLDVMAPEGPPGPATVRVVSPFGEDEAVGAFLFHDGDAGVASPAVLGLWPGRGPSVGGREVVVLAEGLDPASRLSFGGSPAEVLEVRPGEGWLRALVPPGEPGESTVTLLAGDAPVFAGTFLYEVEPTVVSATPASAPASGGAEIVLRVRDLPQGDADVWFDGLPAAAVQRIDAERVRVVVPPGSPGPVRLRLGPSVAEGLFTYTAPARRLVGTSPSAVPANGGAWVRVFGTRLDEPVRVMIGGTRCDDLQIVSPVELRCRSPRALVGAAALELLGQQGGVLWSEVVPDAVTVYEPRKKKGGTVGEPLAGTLSVTAVDGSTGLGVPGATVSLRLVDGSGRATGTDEEGRATFSFDELVGPVDVSVVRPGYTAASVLGFDATRVTIYVYSSEPPTPGEEPPSQPMQTQYGKITGAVLGVDKYIPMPPGSCSRHAGAFPVLCQPCDTNAACGVDGVCSPRDEGSFCLTPCASDTDCPATFACAGAPGGKVVCQPRLGERRTRCSLSKPSLFAYVGGATELSEVGPQGTFQIVARPGDVAIVCTAGVVRFDDGTFLPLVMGVRRNVFVPQGMYVPDQDVTLDLPLTRTVRLSLQDVPQHPAGNRPLEVRSFVVLGTDGAIELDTGAPVVDGDQVRLQRFPQGLSGPLEGGRYAFYATARANTPEWYPYSVVLDQDLAYLTSGGVLSGAGSTWALQPLLSERDLHALAGDTADSLLAVGDDGLLVQATPSGWFPQYAPLDADWRGVCRRADGGDVVVGSEGGVLERAPGQPFGVVPTGVPRDLFGCREVDGVTWVGGRGVILERAGDAWQKTWLATDERVLGFVTVGAALLAFTDQGALYEHKLAYWLPTDTPWLAGEPLVAGVDGWLLSARGHVFRHDGAAWRYDATLDGTPRALAGSADAPCAVGDDGAVWCRGALGWESPPGLPSDLPDLRAARRLVDGTLVAVGAQARRLGPFMPYPTLVWPPPLGLLDEPRFLWDLGTAVTPSYLQQSLIAPGEGTFWSLVAAGDQNELRLPPGPFAGASVLVLFTAAYAPGFDLDHFIYADTSSTLRRTWASAYREVAVSPDLIDFGTLP